MPRQAIEQAVCTECHAIDENLTVTDKDMGFDDDDEPYIEYDTRCACGREGSVTVDSDGTSANDALSYEEASWNTDSDESEDDE